MLLDKKLIQYYKNEVIEMEKKIQREEAAANQHLTHPTSELQPVELHK